MFDTAIAWLRQEMDALRRQRQHRQELLKTVEEVVEIADPIIRLANHYQKKLLPSVETAVTYFDHLVSLLPGPVRL